MGCWKYDGDALDRSNGSDQSERPGHRYAFSWTDKKVFKKQAKLSEKIKTWNAKRDKYNNELVDQLQKQAQIFRRADTALEYLNSWLAAQPSRDMPSTLGSISNEDDSVSVAPDIENMSAVMQIRQSFFGSTNQNGFTKFIAKKMEDAVSLIKSKKSISDKIVAIQELIRFLEFHRNVANSKTTLLELARSVLADEKTVDQLIEAMKVDLKNKHFNHKTRVNPAVSIADIETHTELLLYKVIHLYKKTSDDHHPGAIFQADITRMNVDGVTQEVMVQSTDREAEENWGEPVRMSPV